MLRLLVGVGVLLLGLFWTDLAVQRTLTTSSSNAVEAVENELNRTSFLPSVLARDPRLVELILSPSPQQVAELNKTFELSARSSGADHIFLMNVLGTTLAASNWESESSFVGRNYSFRPYFKEAINNGSATFFAVGATTGKPGYFLARAVTGPQGRHIGVVVVKISMSGLIAQVSERLPHWFIVDDLGVSILASAQEYYYRIWRAREGQVETAQEQQRYQVNEAAFVQIVLGGDLQFTTLSAEGSFSGIFLERSITSEPWSLVAVVTTREMLLMFTWRVALLALLILTLWLSWTLYRAQQSRVHELNEQAVQIRGELEDTQAELVRKESWAAIGKMSAAIAHEVNQPLASLRFDLASIGKTIATGGKEAEEAIDEAKHTSTRIARIIETLRLFARQNELELSPISVCEGIENALKLFAKDRPQASTYVKWEHTGGNGPFVLANSTLFEQVLINLLSNAVAAADRDNPVVRLSGPNRVNGCLEIVVFDNGPDTDFVRAKGWTDHSTKPLVEGFGLGLSLSRRFVERIGGKLVASRQDGWTAVKITMSEHHDDS